MKATNTHGVHLLNIKARCCNIITYKPYTIAELVTMIHEDNLEHFDIAEHDCDCHLHITLKTVIDYWEQWIACPT